MTTADGVLLELVGDLQGVHELREFQVALLDALHRALPSDWISLNGIAEVPEQTWGIARPEVPPALVARWPGLAHQNPLIARYRETDDGRAYRFSDVIDRDAYHALELYREFYAHLGIEHQMAVTLPTRPGHVLGIALSRTRTDYSDAERALLERARPFVIEAYRAVLEFEGLRRAAASGSAAMLARLADLGLTAREASVVRQIALGASAAQAGAQLGISERTVHKHLQHAYRKLGVDSRSAAAQVAWGEAR